INLVLGHFNNCPRAFSRAYISIIITDSGTNYGPINLYRICFKGVISMAIQILFNFLIALIWMFLQNDFSFTSFLLGYMIGIIILFVLRRFLLFRFYIHRVWAIFKLIIIFIIELTKANIDVVKIVFTPKLKNKPGIVAMETELTTEVEITLLAALISLTPGTISMDFSADNKTLYIHALDIQDKKQMIEEIRNSFERAIMEVTK